jgi:hypothetical protein
MKHFLLALMFLLTVSCASIYVNYDYDKTADFSKYKTYQYFGDLKTGLSELDTKRLLNALDSTLANKGFAISNTPDLLIDIKSSDYKSNRETVGLGVGGTGGNLGGGITIGLPLGQAKTTRVINFEFVDAKTKQLFWQAKSESGFNTNTSPEQRENRLKAIVNKVFKKYPQPVVQ